MKPGDQYYPREPMNLHQPPRSAAKPETFNGDLRNLPAALRPLQALWFVINEMLRRGYRPEAVEATLTGLEGNPIAANRR